MNDKEKTRINFCFLSRNNNCTSFTQYYQQIYRVSLDQMIQLHQYVLKIRKELLRNIKILKKYYKHMKSFYYILCFHFKILFPITNATSKETEFITLQISSLYFIFFFYFSSVNALLIRFISSCHELTIDTIDTQFSLCSP